MDFKLVDKSLNCLIENKDIDKLIYLLNSNFVNENQKKIIYGCLIAINDFIIHLKEKYYNSLKDFKHIDNISTISKYLKDFEDFKGKNFINNIFTHIHGIEHNINDEMFLWFIFNAACESKLNTTKKYNVSIKCFLLKNRPGHAKICHFSSNMVKYFKLLEGTKFCKENMLLAHNCNIIDRYTSFTFHECELSFEKDMLHISYMHKICSHKKRDLFIRTRIIMNFFIHNGGIYVGYYRKYSRVIDDITIFFDAHMITDKPFIKSGSKCLDELIPILDGSVVSDKSYDGNIVNGNYTKTNIKENNVKFSEYNFLSIVKEIEKLRIKFLYSI